MADRVVVRIISSDQYNTLVTATLLVGEAGKEVTASFAVTTRHDTTPEDFAFSPASRTNIEPNTFVTATTFITGINDPNHRYPKWDKHPSALSNLWRKHQLKPWVG